MTASKKIYTPKVQRIGGCLCINLPKDFTVAFDVNKGDMLIGRITEEGLTLRPFTVEVIAEEAE